MSDEPKQSAGFAPTWTMVLALLAGGGIGTGGTIFAGPSTDALKELTKEVKGMSVQLTTITAENNAFERRLTRIAAAVDHHIEKPHAKSPVESDQLNQIKELQQRLLQVERNQ